MTETCDSTQIELVYGSSVHKDKTDSLSLSSSDNEFVFHNGKTNIVKQLIYTIFIL